MTQVETRNMHDTNNEQLKMTGSKAYLNIVFFLGVNNIIRFYKQVFADSA